MYNIKKKHRVEWAIVRNRVIESKLERNINLWVTKYRGRNYVVRKYEEKFNAASLPKMTLFQFHDDNTTVIIVRYFTPMGHRQK